MTQIDDALILKKIQLATAIQSLSIDDQAKVRRALEVAEAVHASQERSTGQAYIHHPLNVALTIVNTFHIHNADLLCAALLHDTLEDQSEALGSMYGDTEDEGRAELVLERLFGHRVARLVYALSNPQVAARSQEAKNLFYKEHVAEMIRDPQVSVVKLADVYDNALRIETLPADKREHFVHKYGPVLRDVWLPFMYAMTSDHLLYPVKNEIIANIEKALQHFIL